MARHQRPANRQCPELWLRDGTLIPAPRRLVNAHRASVAIVTDARRARFATAVIDQAQR